MRRAGAQALAPGLVQLERNPAAEIDTLNAAALSLLRFTPSVSIDSQAEAMVLLEVSASLRLFGGHRALCREAWRCLQPLGVRVRLGSGVTARGAAWLAMAPRSPRQPGLRRAIREITMQRYLARLPVAVAAELSGKAPSGKTSEGKVSGWLEEIGCRTLGGLRRLPRSGLQHRGGGSMLAALDHAWGMAPELFDWFVPPLRFERVLELPDRMENAAGILAGVQYLLAQLGGWLAAHHCGVTHYRLILQHERRRGGALETAVDIALAEPTRDAAHLMRVLTARVTQLHFSTPVVGLRLVVEQADALVEPTAALFAEPAGSPQVWSQLLDALVARLGREQVLQPAPLADHRPARANRWLPCGAMSPAELERASRQSGRCEQVERPFWLLETPIALQEKGGKPFYGTSLTLRGPAERIETGWWDDGFVARDYFIADSTDGVCYWLYRERVTGRIHWYLHGLFG